MYVETEYVSGEWFGLSPSMKHTIWQVSKDVRAGMPLILKRVHTYSNTSSNESYATVLECCGVTMNVAQLKDERNADFVLDGWIKQMDKALSKYELQSPAMKPSRIDDADSFAAAIILSKTYREKHQEENKENK